MNEPKADRSITGFLVASVFVLSILAAAILAPLAPCPVCRGYGTFPEYGVSAGPMGCGRCDATGRVTLLKRWQLRNVEPIRDVDGRRFGGWK